MAFYLLVQFGGTGLKLKMPTTIDPSLIFNHNQSLTVSDWTDLFGSMDMCSCDECHAMGSTAAYFVDILHFLQDRKLKPPQDTSSTAQSPQVRLFQRRPDLLDMELCCANANTPLPYTDLVLEILEDAISLLPPFNEIHLIDPPDEQAASTLAKQLDQNKLDTIGDKFNPRLSRVSIIKLCQQYTIDETTCSYSVESSGSDIIVRGRSRQSTGSPQELAANPKYINFAGNEPFREAEVQGGPTLAALHLRPNRHVHLQSTAEVLRTKMFFEITSEEYKTETLPEFFPVLAGRGVPEATKNMSKEKRAMLADFEAGVRA
ncbi:hypothetical protein EDB80DRAFT_678734 [Ilyonectria destructans]|nr:hypothetical protein EDB80DRAFT_678734 [Ilyonectria destructans]